MSATMTPRARELIDRRRKPIRSRTRSHRAAADRKHQSPPNSDTDWEYWKTEIKRRIEDVESGKVQTFTLEETLEHIQKALDEGRKSASFRISLCR